MNAIEFTAYVQEWNNIDATLKKGTETFTTAETNSYITTWLMGWEPVMTHPWEAGFLLWMETGNSWEPADRTGYILPKNVYDLGPDAIATYLKDSADLARRLAQSYLESL